jgi:hypothetical protein
MDYLIQIARSFCSLVLGLQSDPMLLKHEPTQRFLAEDMGSTSDPELAFRLSSREAEAFLARYACEPDAWLIVAPAADAAAVAA